ncbi:MAG: type I citrate synthase [Candidatus Lindowbacteria bacterium RIFCSPLOWO2_12_FULL_62_27]|nr:MAG: type I citrate synthase [Candidatus Lindowbacteria bacterium RIFCSPLOWO2_12_FULL_62_27]OGH63385.1 MAG: type I citrate synthase [Candidatus Lindowbacteria bacterium RIFCSPLOWO2_02_FULL_62_12]
MATLHERLAENIPGLRKELQGIIKQHGARKLSEVTVEQACAGLRSVHSLLCDTSEVDPNRGLLVRGTPISELTNRLPEEIFYFLLTGDIPDADALKSLQNDLRKRADVPDRVWTVVNAVAEEAHPMRMTSIATLSLGTESVFRRRYDEGMKKEEYWEAALEDALTLLARLPQIAAAIYRRRYKLGRRIPSDPKLDWAADYAQMLGVPDPKGEFARLMRLYMTLHCDHEGGNASAFTSHVVSSTLSDPYYAVSAGFNALAGPLHGLANQECLEFVLGIHKKFKGAPTEDEYRDYCWDVLNSGRVIPGYGHAVLRVTDPRFTAFHQFGKLVCPNDEVFRIVDMGYKVIPEVLKKQGKAKNTWPNVDAGSGALLYHFGVTQATYYTVFFAVSRALGLLAQLVLDRAMLIPLTRPKSFPTAWLKTFINQSDV